MYLPPQFESPDPRHASEIIRRFPFASLVTADADGLPFVTHLPLHLAATDDAGGPTRLLGHVARANPHGRFLARQSRALVTFVGPHAYLSPAVYPDLARVPTWNYLAVHCTVEARLIDPVHEKDALLKALIGDHEPRYADQWRSLPEHYQQRMLGGITAFELDVVECQCKLKVNQHRPEARDAMLAAYRSGTPDARLLADWIERVSPAPD